MWPRSGKAISEKLETPVEELGAAFSSNLLPEVSDLYG
jgi:hypothetical protein